MHVSRQRGWTGGRVFEIRQRRSSLIHVQQPRNILPPHQWAITTHQTRLNIIMNFLSNLVFDILIILFLRVAVIKTN